jgi:hypothetical protein
MHNGEVMFVCILHMQDNWMGYDTIWYSEFIIKLSDKFHTGYF